MLVIKAFISSFQELQTSLSDFSNILKHTDSKFPNSSHSHVFFGKHYSKIKQTFNGSNSIFTELNPIENINSLKKDGFALSIKLHPDVVREMISLTRKLPCYSDRKNERSFYYSEKTDAETKYGEVFVKGIYDESALINPVIHKIENDPKILEIVTTYLGTTSVQKRHQLWWKFAEQSNLYERRRAAQMFYDNQNSGRGVTFFFYLTDVNLCSSPHVCVRGSHIKKKLSHLFLRRGYTYPQITEYYGYQNIVPICGKAGFGFVVDTRCLQKANPPGSKDRLMLEIEFTVRG